MVKERDKNNVDSPQPLKNIMAFHSIHKSTCSFHTMPLVSTQHCVARTILCPNHPLLNARDSTVTDSSRHGTWLCSYLFHTTSRMQTKTNLVHTHLQQKQTKIQYGSQIGPLCPVKGRMDVGGHAQATRLKATALNTPLSLCAFNDIIPPVHPQSESYLLASSLSLFPLNLPAKSSAHIPCHNPFRPSLPSCLH